MASTIRLDWTLRQLYGLDTRNERDVYLAFPIPTSTLQLTKGIPISTKYVYQDPLSLGGRDLQARLWTQLVPQQFAMIAGKMNLIMFDLDTPGDREPDTKSRQDTANIMQQLAEHQRPAVTFVPGAADIALPPDAVLAVANPIDCLAGIAPAVPPELHYRALSKRELVFSGLPTPPTRVIDTLLNAQQVLDQGLHREEVARMTAFVEEERLPFVAKLPQAHAGQGVFLIRTEDERAAALAILRPEVDRMLRQVNQSNAHMNPACLIIQEMGAWVSFIDAGGRWGGGHISYPNQPRLKTEYLGIANRIGHYLHRIGYYGPLGADIMTGQDGEHLVIDLNVRVTGSYMLGAMTDYLHVKRGFNDASVVTPLYLSLSLVLFKARFQQELDEGRAIIAGWCHEGNGERSVAALVIAGEDDAHVVSLLERVKEFSLPIE